MSDIVEATDWGRLRRIIRDGARSAVNLLFPACCSICARPAGQAGDFAGVCGGCAAETIPVVPHACNRCGAPVGPFASNSQGCVHCRRDRFAFESVVTLGRYADGLRTVVQRMKADGGHLLSSSMGRMLAAAQQKALESFSADVIVAVPDHWSQRLFRSHHAAETVARAIAETLKRPLRTGFIRKCRRTTPQSTLSPAARRKNLHGAFVVPRRAAVENRRILLVDDVLTTGTTAQRISRLLRKRGAAAIMVAVVARGLGDPRAADNSSREVVSF